MNEIRIVPAVLGWRNPERNDVQLRLYATDRGPSPRWDGRAGRVAEQAITEGGANEGDRFLVVRLSDRFIDTADVDAAAEAVRGALESLPGVGGTGGER